MIIAREVYVCIGWTKTCTKKPLSALQLMRTDNNFKLFWHYVDQRKSKVEGISSPILARHK